MTPHPTHANLWHPDHPDRPDHPEHWHPHWCARQHCTAHAPENTIERTYHRSKPIILPDDTDTHLAWYLHHGANPDGTTPYLEITLLETPVAGHWWHPTQPPLTELAISLHQAHRLNKAITALLPPKTRPLTSAR